MDFQKLARSRFGIGLVILIGRLVPVKIAYRLSRLIADRIATHGDSPLVRAIRLNQWVVGGKSSSSADLDHATRTVLRHAARCAVDMYHNLANPRGIFNLIKFSPRLEAIITRSKEGSGPGLLIGLHLSNFDLALIAWGLKGMQVQVLSYSDPTGGYEWQNRLRIGSGLEVTPISGRVLRKAIRRLRNGGYVMTAVDRPIPGVESSIQFFDLPALLPDGYIRLALDSGAPIQVVYTFMRTDGTYFADITDPIEEPRHVEGKEKVRVYAEAVLKVLESLIREHPHQWLMYYPVWPELLDEVT